MQGGAGRYRFLFHLWNMYVQKYCTCIYNNEQVPGTCNADDVLMFLYYIYIIYNIIFISPRVLVLVPTNVADERMFF